MFKSPEAGRKVAYSEMAKGEMRAVLVHWWELCPSPGTSLYCLCVSGQWLRSFSLLEGWSGQGHREAWH